MDKKLLVKLGLGGVVVATALSAMVLKEKNDSLDIAKQSNSNESKIESSVSNNDADNKKDIDSKSTTSKKTEDSSINKSSENKVVEKESESVNNNDIVKESSKNTEKQNDTISVDTSKNESEKNKEQVEQQVQEKQDEDNLAENNTAHSDVDNLKNKTEEERAEYYYNSINDAMQKQIEYIKSLKDPQTQAAVQSSTGAATSQSVLLEIHHPEDAQLISESLKKVLNT